MTLSKFLRGLVLPHLTMLAAASSYATPQAPLHVDVFNPGPKAVFPVSSEIVTGQRDAILIDAQFDRTSAEQLVKKIKATGKRLTTVYVSQGDPDFYFGLNVIQDAFPEARIVATPQTVAKIQATKDDKLAVWGPQLKDEAPKRLVVPEPLRGDRLKLEGQDLQIRGLSGPDPSRTYVWIPSQRIVAGGTLVESGEHVFMADTPTPESRQAWLAELNGMASLYPRLVIPGHFIGNIPPGLDAVKFTASYLRAFDRASASASDSTELINAMKKAYPTLDASLPTLEMSAKVVKGEMEWPVYDPNSATNDPKKSKHDASPRKFPASGKLVDVTMGDYAYRLDFSRDGQTMTFNGISTATQGETDTVKYTAVELRPNLYMVYWTEPKSGDQVVHIEDFERGIVYSNIYPKNGEALHLSGTLRVVGDSKQ
jgi:glyoxylase-like metal-dependent hydrolase (beta-lactamase superfamily II)